MTTRPDRLDLARVDQSLHEAIYDLSPVFSQPSAIGWLLGSFGTMTFTLMITLSTTWVLIAGSTAVSADTTVFGAIVIGGLGAVLISVLVHGPLVPVAMRQRRGLRVIVRGHELRVEQVTSGAETVTRYLLADIDHVRVCSQGLELTVAGRAVWVPIRDRIAATRGALGIEIANRAAEARARDGTAHEIPRELQVLRSEAQTT